MVSARCKQAPGVAGWAPAHYTPRLPISEFRGKMGEGGMTMGRVVAVTGATGFVGRHICRALATRGYVVRALVRDPEKARRSIPIGADGSLQWVVGEVGDRGVMRELASGSEAIIHTIGIRRELRPAVTFARLHPGATRAVIEAAQGAAVGRLVHISALGTRPDAVSDYHRSKFESETLVRRSGLDWTILRPSLIHGLDGEFMQMIKAWVLSRAAPWFFLPYFVRVEKGEGFPPKPTFVSALIQPVGVDDVADAAVSALESPQSIGEVYALGGAEVLDWPTLLTTVRDAMPITERRKRVIPIPGRLGWIKAIGAEAVGMGSLLPFGPSEPIMAMEDSVCALDKAREHLGFQPHDFTGAVRQYAAMI